MRLTKRSVSDQERGLEESRRREIRVSLGSERSFVLPRAKAGGHVVIPRTSEVVGFAPCRPHEKVCRDEAGRWRPRHFYSEVRYGDCERCIHCGRTLMVEVM